MEAKACSNCQHWRPIRSFHCNWGNCEKIYLFLEGVKAYTTIITGQKCADGSGVTLKTREDFYCSEFTPRTPALAHVQSNTVPTKETKQ